jgi:hypothetical protein
MTRGNHLSENLVFTIQGNPFLRKLVLLISSFFPEALLGIPFFTFYVDCTRSGIQCGLRKNITTQIVLPVMRSLQGQGQMRQLLHSEHVSFASVGGQPRYTGVRKRTLRGWRCR